MTSEQELRGSRCEPCEGGIPPMSPEAVSEHLRAVPAWTCDGVWLERDLTFKDFREALAFVNRVGDVAEDQGHHPDLSIHGWNRVKVRISTHAIGGLSRNDFILAAKIDELRPR